MVTPSVLFLLYVLTDNPSYWGCPVLQSCTCNVQISSSACHHAFDEHYDSNTMPPNGAPDLCKYCLTCSAISDTRHVLHELSMRHLSTFSNAGIAQEILRTGDYHFE